MNPQSVMALGQNALELTLLVSAPMLLGDAHPGCHPASRVPRPASRAA